MARQRPTRVLAIPEELRKARGREAWDGDGQPTDDVREVVRMMSAIGVPRAVIAACVPTPRGIGVSLKRLEELFGQELITGRAVINAMVGSKLLKAAMNCVVEHMDPATGAVEIEIKQAGVNAAIFWMRSQGLRTAGERDPDEVYRQEMAQSDVEEIDKLDGKDIAELGRMIAEKLRGG